MFCKVPHFSTICNGWENTLVINLCVESMGILHLKIKLACPISFQSIVILLLISFSLSGLVIVS